MDEYGNGTEFYTRSRQRDSGPDPRADALRAALTDYYRVHGKDETYWTLYAGDICDDGGILHLRVESVDRFKGITVAYQQTAVVGCLATDDLDVDYSDKAAVAAAEPVLERANESLWDYFCSDGYVIDGDGEEIYLGDGGTVLVPWQHRSTGDPDYKAMAATAQELIAKATAHIDTYLEHIDSVIEETIRYAKNGEKED
jgi:hypothetical protein